MNNEIGSDEQHLEGCANSSIIMEPMTSERYCETCGTVQNASETSEHYSSDTNPDPQKYHYSSADHKQANHGLGSEITSKEELKNKALEDSQGNKVKGKNKELFSKNPVSSGIILEDSFHFTSIHIFEIIFLSSSNKQI